MTRRGEGSLRQRAPDRWEIRVSLGPDPVSGRAVVVSRTVHGGLAAAKSRQAALAAEATQLRAERTLPLRTVADVLGVWLDAAHDWKPSTWRGYRQAAARLSCDRLGRRALSQLSPPVLHAAVAAWTVEGVPPSTRALHVRTLRAAFGWAHEQRLLAQHPLAGMRGLPQCEPRRDVPVPIVAALLAAADAEAATVQEPRAQHRAEQLRLLLYLAADTGARRGELAALRTDDLTGRRLRIERGLSDEVLTTTKTGRCRTLTLGATTAALWRTSLHTWQSRAPTDFGPWMFSANVEHDRRLGCGRLGRLFSNFCRRHDYGDVTLHRLRHTVATVLVAEGLLLQAQQRLGHREASTTLRPYCHALPLHDQDVADHLEQRYRDHG